MLIQEDVHGGEIMEIKRVKLSEIRPYEKNPRRNDSAVDADAASIKEFGWQQPIVVDKYGVIIAGHTRYKAAKKLKCKEVPVVYADNLTEEQVKAYRLADNKTSELAEWDVDLLSEELLDLQDFDMGQFGFDFPDEPEIEELKYGKCDGSRSLFDKYVIPPFSVLDGRSGIWQERKRKWHEILKTDSRAGRAEGLLGEGLNQMAKNIGSNLNGTSEFDPVLCELMIRWFCPKGGRIIDPFAGGNVRGLVSMYLGDYYTGVDLRQEQIDENNKALEKLIHTDLSACQMENKPTWHCGDSMDIKEIVNQSGFDFLLMCPPYGDLEKYSDDPKDISNMTYENFISTYSKIISRTVSLLKNDAYCAVVISDIRDKKGMYRGFYSDTIKAFKDAGCSLYNDIVKIDPVATAALRADLQFKNGRKVVRTHQNVLVFIRGNNKNINLEPYDFVFDEETEE